mgnify:CR=1 FL=1
MSIRRLAMAALFVLLADFPRWPRDSTKLRVKCVRRASRTWQSSSRRPRAYSRSHGLEVELQFTPNSPAQREGLTKGR